MSRRRIRQITDKPGTLSDETGRKAKVRFSLTTWQDMIDGTIPGMHETTGSVQGLETADARYFTRPDLTVKLLGAGIEAEILMDEDGTFTATGRITEMPK